MAYLKRIILPLFLPLILFALVVPCFAQEQNGMVAGVVKDPTNAVLPDVSVKLISRDTNRTAIIQTRSDGSYTFPAIEPGHYSVVFEKTGFMRSEVKDMLVVVGKTTTVDVSLQMGTV